MIHDRFAEYRIKADTFRFFQKQIHHLVHDPPAFKERVDHNDPYLCYGRVGYQKKCKMPDHLALSLCYDRVELFAVVLQYLLRVVKKILDVTVTIVFIDQVCDALLVTFLKLSYGYRQVRIDLFALFIFCSGVR